MNFTPNSDSQPIEIDSLGLVGNVKDMRDYNNHYGEARQPWVRSYDVASNSSDLNDTSGNPDTKGVYGRLDGVTHTPQSPNYDSLTKYNTQLPLFVEEQPTLSMLFGNLGPRAAAATVGKIAHDSLNLTGQRPKADDTLSPYGAALTNKVQGSHVDPNWVGEDPDFTYNRIIQNRFITGQGDNVSRIPTEHLDSGFNAVMGEIAKNNNKRPIQVGRNPQDFTEGKNSQRNFIQGELSL